MTSRDGENDLSRDFDATMFSRLLAGLVHGIPEALCAVFVDGEGETVDLASRVDPFDARIAAAEMSIVLHGLRQSREKLDEGRVLELRIEGNKRSILVRHVSKGYDLVVLLGAAAVSAHAAELAVGAASSLAREAGLTLPPATPLLRAVELRPSRIGILVPASFEENGVRHRIAAILGHRDDGDGVVRFLVRLEDGEELVVLHDRTAATWVRT